MSKIRVALVDDQHLFRQTLAMLINSEPEFTLVAEAENGNHFLAQLEQMEELPHVVLADLNMPECNGVELNDILHSKYPDIKVIILTIYDQERFVSKLIEAGANGYLIKNCNAEEVVAAIKSVYRTGFYLDDKTLAAIRNGAQYKSKKIYTNNNIPLDLTDREREILQLICKEYTNAEIGERLYISARTVEGHRNKLLAKTGSRNTAGLVLFAIKNGLYDISLS